MGSFIDKPPKGWDDYTCTYFYDGKHYNIDVRATSFEDAKKRLSAMSLGRVDGKIMARIPATKETAPLVKAFFWVRNFVKGL